MKIQFTGTCSIVAFAVLPLVTSFIPQSRTIQCRQGTKSAFTMPSMNLNNNNENTNINQVNAVDTKDVEEQRRLEKSIEQRLADMAFMEKQLLERLNDLSRSEHELESRLTKRKQSNYSTNGSRLTAAAAAVPVDRATHGDADTVASSTPNKNSLDAIWESSQITTLLGGTLRTWSFSNPAVKRVHVLLKSDGRPLHADLEMWQGPNNTPYTIKVFVEDGGQRTFHTLIDAPCHPNTIRIRNTGPMECPIHGCVSAENDDNDDNSVSKTIDRTTGEIIQGGALRVYAFDSCVTSVAVMIKTFGMPLNARIELIQGSNNVKQVLTVCTEDGMIRPFAAIIETPGMGSVVRVVNTGSVEYPIHTAVSEHDITNNDDVYAHDDFNAYSPYDNDGLCTFGNW